VKKINLGNVGWRALLKRIDPLFPDPDGAETMSQTLDTMAANQNEIIDRVKALEGRQPSAPFPAGS
jgi:hypothetical protein